MIFNRCYFVPCPSQIVITLSPPILYTWKVVFFLQCSHFHLNPSVEVSVQRVSSACCHLKENRQIWVDLLRAPLHRPAPGILQHHPGPRRQHQGLWEALWRKCTQFCAPVTCWVAQVLVWAATRSPEPIIFSRICLLADSWSLVNNPSFFGMS